jgi:hypothetical protein
MMAMEPKDGKDPKRARVVLSKGREVVRPGYSRVTSVAAKVTDKRGNLVTTVGLRGLARQSNATRIGLAGLPGLAKTTTRTGKQIRLARLP